ncbi:hypothetical protein [Streptomyces sp. NPDC091371]|uniref:hypothetical protein n=1 Tax=Streptomyces sp. NPDC091371 TaxID=3155303 RepID=UPI00343A57D5
MSQRTTLILFASALAVVICGLAGVGAAYLARRDGASYPQALSRAAGTFAAGITVVAATATALVNVIGQGP